MSKKIGYICSGVCAIVLIVILAIQFLPYWTFPGESGELTMAIGEYILFPNQDLNESSEVSDAFEAYIKPLAYSNLKPGDYMVNKIVMMPAMLLLLCLLGLAGCILQRKSKWPSIYTTIITAFAVCTYIFNAALKVGSPWLWHLIVCICGLLVAIACIVLYFVYGKKAAK